MKLGTSQAQREQLEGKENPFEDQHKIKEKKNLFRFIQGPQKIKTIFIPTIKELEEDGVKKIKPSFTAFNFLDSAGILEKAFSAEERIRKEMGEEKPDYALQPKTNWFYLAIDLMEQGPFKVKPLKTPKTIKDDIYKAETELDLQDPEVLLNGPYYLYDMLIEKDVDPKKGKRYGTSYSAKPYSNKFEKQVPASWLNANASDVIEKIGLTEIFNEKMIAAIEECQIDLEEALTPMDVEDIENKLSKYPINLLGKRWDGGYAFPQVEDFKIALESLGVPIVEFDFGTKQEIIVGKPDSKEDKPQISQNQEIKSGGLASLKRAIPKVEPTNEEPEEEEVDSPAPEISKPAGDKPKSLKDLMKKK